MHVLRFYTIKADGEILCVYNYDVVRCLRVLLLPLLLLV